MHHRVIAPPALGTHLIADLWVRDPAVLNDAALVKRALLAAAEHAGLAVVAVKVHPFSPHGITGFLLLAESHLAIHTWPEHGYAAVDLFTCGGEPRLALRQLEAQLGAEAVAVQELRRGRRADADLAAPGLTPLAVRPAGF